MSKIYTDEGWVNWEYLYSQTPAFCMVVGARAVGKTYGLLRYIAEHGIKFIYLRRLKTQLDACADMDGNPFKRVNADTGIAIEPFSAKSAIRFYETIVGDDGKAHPVGDVKGYGLSLSTVATIRGIDFSDVDCIVFDEAVPMAGEKPVKDEFNAFRNFYETVNRNRELEGGQPVKAFLLGNSNKLSNPYFAGWGFMRTALRMIKGGQMLWRSADNTRIMVMLLRSPISEKKKGTALYAGGSDSFTDMALDNAFAVDPTNIKPRKLKEYRHIVSVGEIGIYTHKSTGEHFVSKTVSKDNYFDGYGIRLTMFRRTYPLLKDLYLSGFLVFEDYESELIFREYIEIA